MKFENARCFLVLAGFVLLSWTSPVDGDDASSLNKQMEEWWVDLAKSEPDASRALLKFAFKFEKSIPFLKEKLKPLKIEAAEARQLIQKLGDSKEEVWKPAYEKLEYFDPRLAIDLETLMDETKDKLTRSRLVALLSGRLPHLYEGKEVTLRPLGNGEGYNFFDGRGSWWAEHRVAMLRSDQGWGNPKMMWIRAVRAINLLDQIGSTEAMDVIRFMATGHPDAEPTVIAKARLAAKELKKP